MTWKERRTVTLLLSIIAVLFAALLIVFGMRYREGREEALSGKTVGDPAGNGTLTNPAAYSGLRYYNGSATLSFALDEDGKWIWVDGPDFPLNDATVTSIIETLSSLRFQQVLAAGESKEEYGLDTPAATLTASGGTAVQTMAFGKATTDGDSYYMMMNDDESTVYIIADTLMKLMQIPIYDMCALPELPDFDEPNLRAVTIQGAVPAVEQPEEGGEEPEGTPERPAVTLNARRSGGEDQSALWFSGNDNVTASKLLQDLLHDLKTMSMAKCVDYRPSEEAAEICGFDNPDAILKVEYAAAGTDRTFILTVGNRMPDGSGRYVQLGEESTIYAVPSDSIDAVMSISVHGMRGALQEDGQEE